MARARSWAASASSVRNVTDGLEFADERSVQYATDREDSLHAARLRIGMAVVAVLHPLFWFGRRGIDPAEAEVEWVRIAIVLVAVALIGFTYSATAVRRFGQLAMLAGIALVLGGGSWILALQGWRTEYVIAPTIVFFVVAAVAANPLESALVIALALVAPAACTLAHGVPLAQLPVVPMLLVVSAAVGGTFVSWFRVRSQTLLREEIARRAILEADLDGARAHLESILNATSDGILGVRYTPEGPRITFANRRFGELFELPPRAVVGALDDAVRDAAARSFRHPEEFERNVAWLYAHPDAVRVDELELVHPSPGVLERWSGPIESPDGAIVGRIWAFRDVTVERGMQREIDEHAAWLEATNAELARASRAKDLFLANLSHELRTPLSVIIGYLNHVLEGGLTPDEVIDFLQRSNRSAVHLLQLISDMLDLTRLESGTAVLSVEPIAVGPVVEEVRALAEVLASAKGLALDLRLDPDLRVFADPQRLKQVLLNLVGNALKFTSAGGVTVSAVADGGEVVFLVRDTGCGIPLDQQELLFGKFMRLDSRATAPVDGVGLGLSICRELVTLMGGKIGLTSAGLGEGTEVRFTLPSAASDERCAAVNP